MKKTWLCFGLGVAGLLISDAASSWDFSPPSPYYNLFSRCYRLDNYQQTDFLVVDVLPNQQVVGRYRQCVEGAAPGTGSVDAILSGTIQKVPVGNTIPAGDDIPQNLNGQVQISMSGSLATGNFGGGAANKVSKCWLHLAFADNWMQKGEAFGACDWFGPDRFAEPITAIPCKEMPTLSGSCPTE